MANGRGRKPPKKNLIIIRGLPGVGKKSYARKLLDEYGRPDVAGGIYSASYYHAMNNWNKFYFSRNHKWNIRDVFRAMKEGVDPIIVYNIHCLLSDMWPYVNMGMSRGDYHITIMELPEGYPKNAFSINQLYRFCRRGYRIERMKEGYEPVMKMSSMTPSSDRSGCLTQRDW
ncbi:NEDD4-binding protein 2-like 1 isoform X2 [Salmo trutta]|uniref:NEDD4-binding protein 2-like 1 isoform X2 n=1 Tax=Salmo trutta TaxID=8032 RepID=UPI0011306BB5|nr:NEDD4-binding protein 2-like 1 isoform X2 [Salmo trutta]